MRMNGIGERLVPTIERCIDKGLFMTLFLLQAFGSFSGATYTCHSGSNTLSKGFESLIDQFDQ